MTQYPRTVLGAGMLVTFVLGSIHAFSIFIGPMETMFEQTRGNISLVYSIALVCLTVMVLYGYRLYHRAHPGWIVMIACGGAASGIAITAHANQLWHVFIGYSLIFGAANGLGYGFVLQLVARAMPNQKGFAMGAVTAAYAIGATVFARGLAELVSPHSPAGAFWVLAGTLLLTGGIAAALIFRTGIRYQEDNDKITADGVTSPPMFFYWSAYGLSVFAGLMAIGHAAGIVQSGHSSDQNSAELAIWGAVLIGAGNAIGGFAVGYLSDRIAIR
ncbi:MAG: MFS transporter, partial [bacterium]